MAMFGMPGIIELLIVGIIGFIIPLIILLIVLGVNRRGSTKNIPTCAAVPIAMPPFRFMPQVARDAVAR